MSGSSLALSNLRAFVILIVLAFHSFLAYLGSLPDAPFPFDIAPFRWNAFPIVDSQRWFGFDIFCAFQDVYLMSFMFFMSGLFVWPSLKRKGTAVFLSDRFLRIGVPFLGAVLILAPIALYPAYLVTATDPSVSAFWEHWLALPFWPSGPAWFLWQLLALNILAAAMFRFAPSWGEQLGRISAIAAERAAALFRPAGHALGHRLRPARPRIHALGLEDLRHRSRCSSAGRCIMSSISSPASASARTASSAACSASPARWRGDGRAWLAAFLAAFVVWAGPIALMPDRDNGPIGLQIVSDFGFVLACACGCFFVAGASLRFAQWRFAWLDSSLDSAYGMYLIHYVFVVWLQYALLGRGALRHHQGLDRVHRGRSSRVGAR